MIEQGNGSRHIEGEELDILIQRLEIAFRKSEVSVKIHLKEIGRKKKIEMLEQLIAEQLKTNKNVAQALAEYYLSNILGY